MPHVHQTGRATRAGETPASRTHRLGLVALVGLLVLALPAVGAVYVEGEAPRNPGTYVQADVADDGSPLANPLNLTREELGNLSGRALDAIDQPGVLLNMTAEEEAEFQALLARLGDGEHDGVQVDGTGYRFAIAMADVFATGTPDDDGAAGPPAHEPTEGEEDAETETGEANGIAIGSLTLVSAGAMYLIRRLR